MKGGGEVKGEPQCSDKGNLPFPETIEFALRARSELAGCISGGVSRRASSPWMS